MNNDSQDKGKSEDIKGDTSSRLELAKAFPETPEKDVLVDNSALSSIKSNQPELESTDKKSEKVSLVINSTG